MSSTANSTTDVVPMDAGQANLELAQSLRDIAHWVEMHAGDLPELWLGHLNFGNPYKRNAEARAHLATFASALGDRATERLHHDVVEIRAEFGPVAVVAGAKVDDLRDAPPPAPTYEPILGARS